MRRDSPIGARSILNVLLYFTVVVALLGFVQDIYHTLDYGGVDLRNRVVGARLMMEDLDPYYFNWSDAYADTLLDPIDNLENEVSRVTVPPTVLMLHAPLARLPYSAQRLGWLFVQWLLLLASVFVFSRCAKTKDEAKAVWIIGLFLAATPIWRFHVERGQIYILFVLLIALSYWLSARPGRYAALWGGLALGVAVSMRPTLVIICLPMLLFGRWKLLAGAAAGLLVFLLLSMAVFGIPAWGDYASAMRLHEKDSLGLSQTESFVYDYGTIEGMDNVQEFMPFPEINTSAQRVVFMVFGVSLRSLALLLILGAALLAAAWSLLRFRKREVPLAVVFLAGCAIALTCEYFIPAIRAYYSNIMWLVPLSLIALNSRMLLSLESGQLKVALFLLLAGVYGNAAIYWWDYGAVLGEGTIMLFFLWVSACFLQASPRRQESGGAISRLEAA